MLRVKSSARDILVGSSVGTSLRQVYLDDRSFTTPVTVLQLSRQLQGPKKNLIFRVAGRFHRYLQGYTEGKTAESIFSCCTPVPPWRGRANANISLPPCDVRCVPALRVPLVHSLINHFRQKKLHRTARCLYYPLALRAAVGRPDRVGIRKRGETATRIGGGRSKTLCPAHFSSTAPPAPRQRLQRPSPHEGVQGLHELAAGMRRLAEQRRGLP